MRIILFKDALNAGEAQIWAAARRWIQADPKTRLPHAAELFSLLRHPELWQDIWQKFSAQRRFMVKKKIHIWPG